MGRTWCGTRSQGEKDGEPRPEPEPHDNLYVKNLPPGIKEEEIIATFAEARACQGIRISDEGRLYPNLCLSQNPGTWVFDTFPKILSQTQ